MIIFFEVAILIELFGISFFELFDFQFATNRTLRKVMIEESPSIVSGEGEVFVMCKHPCCVVGLV